MRTHYTDFRVLDSRVSVRAEIVPWCLLAAVVIYHLLNSIYSWPVSTGDLLLSLSHLPLSSSSLHHPFIFLSFFILFLSLPLIIPSPLLINCFTWPTSHYFVVIDFSFFHLNFPFFSVCPCRCFPSWYFIFSKGRILSFLPSCGWSYRT